jgi:pimeloyl-ACP methyl ester carboxylesterase
MHINCQGDARPGAPTVVLEAGTSDSSIEWSLVQPAVARFARVCAYDRSGSGWSDLGPYPHTIRQIVYELGATLDAAGVTPPLVMVGHSMGGRYVRLFTADRPRAVAGMVLVDANHEDDLLFINGDLKREWEGATGAAIPPVKTSMPLRWDDIPAATRGQIESVVPQMLAHALDPPMDKLPREAREARQWVMSRPFWLAANNSPFNADETLASRNARRSIDFPLGDMPLVVVTRGEAITRGPRAAEQERERLEHQAELARMSRRGRQVVATKSGHHIQIDEPDVVIGAIRDVVAAVNP